jgi:hypothetical protein
MDDVAPSQDGGPMRHPRAYDVASIDASASRPVLLRTFGVIGKLRPLRCHHQTTRLIHFVLGRFRLLAAFVCASAVLPRSRASTRITCTACHLPWPLGCSIVAILANVDEAAGR